MSSIKSATFLKWFFMIKSKAWNLEDSSGSYIITNLHLQIQWWFLHHFSLHISRLFLSTYLWKLQVHFSLKIHLFLLYVCECLPTLMYVHPVHLCVCGGQKRKLSLWNWSCKWFWDTRWVLGTKLGSSMDHPVPPTAEPSLQPCFYFTT